MEFKPEDFKLNDYYYIKEIKTQKDKIIFYVRERYNSTYKRMVLSLDGRKVTYKNKLECDIDDLTNVLRWDMMSTILYDMQEEQRKKAVEKRKKQAEKMRKEVQIGDIVETSKPTPNGYYYIKVDDKSDYGVDGFYLSESFMRTNEYVCKSFEYIKRVVKKGIENE